MEAKTFVIEKTYDAPVVNVWKAITQRELLKLWYFDMPGFKPEVGCEFSFEANGACEKPNVHLCKVMEVVKNKRLVYTWRYEGHPGDSLVTFELFGEGDQTRLKLTHSGLDTFADELRQKKNFAGSWEWLLGESLMNRLDFSCSFTAEATPAAAFDVVNRVTEWWTENIDGSTKNLGDVFTVDFGKTFLTMKIVESVPGQRVVWEVVDCFIHFVNDNKEWQGTHLVWEILPEGGMTQVRLTHQGLVPQVECYDNCVQGWTFYVKTSIYDLLTKGKGEPQKKREAVTA
ncbi:MAG: SRPBCC domain-containing protein [Bacteroidetes bacterium]|nr:SRPBCC domain-containing protein [Bacteroidota bacterium]